MLDWRYGKDTAGSTLQNRHAPARRGDLSNRPEPQRLLGSLPQQGWEQVWRRLDRGRRSALAVVPGANSASRKDRGGSGVVCAARIRDGLGESKGEGGEVSESFTLEVARFHQAQCDCGWKGGLFKTEFVAGSFKIGEEPWNALDQRACDQANDHAAFHANRRAHPHSSSSSYDNEGIASD